MSETFLKTKDNDLDKLYENIITQSSECSSIIYDNFASSTIKEQRHYGIDIENTTLTHILRDIQTNNKRLEIAKDDYYTYVNERWLKLQENVIRDMEIPFTKIDTFRVFQRQTNATILLVLDKYIKSNMDDKFVKNLLNFIYSCINCTFIEPGVNALECSTNIQKFIETDDLYGLLGSMNANELVNNRCPIYSFLMADLDNASVYNMCITLPSLTLPSYSFYYKYDSDPPKLKRYKKEMMRKYKKYINDVFTICVGGNHSFNPQDVIDVELTIANTYFLKMPESDGFFADKINTSESAKVCGFDFKRFCKTIYYTDKNIPSGYRTYNKYYIKNIMDVMLNNWKSKKWITFWYYVHFNSVVKFSKYSSVWFNFNKKYLRSITEEVTMDRMICGLSFGYNNLITQLLNIAFPRTEEVGFVKKMFEDIQYIFIDIIEHNQWLSKSAKAQALKKLKTINLIVGNTPMIVKDPVITYSDDNFWKNIIDTSIYRAKMFAYLNEKPVAYLSTVDWEVYSLTGQQSYIVNAFYTANQNSIFIPHAILTRPFVDLTNRGIEYNLAYIGFTLSHEISHSLDSIGSRYNYKGNLQNWWKPEDRKIFDTKIKGIVEQYRLFAKRDGLDLDPTLSVGEDLADINGFRLLENYLMNQQVLHKDTSLIKLLSFYALYINYAIQSRQVTVKKSIYLNSLTNPHPLEKYRVNCVLSRSQIFKNLYNVVEGDGMYSNYKKFW